MKSSCISHPANEPLIITRQWQVEFCDGDHCAAALLSFFEYWHNIRLDQIRKSEQSNKVAEMHGEDGTQDTSLLQFHTNDDLRAGLLGQYSKPTVIKGLKLLKTLGVIEIRKNPNPRYKFDKTNYFQFHPEVCQQWLDSRSSNSERSSSKSLRSSSKSERPITETTALDSKKKVIVTPLRDVTCFSSVHKEGLVPKNGKQSSWMAKTIVELLSTERNKVDLNLILKSHRKELPDAVFCMVEYGFQFSEREEEFHNVLVDHLQTLLEEETPLGVVPNTPVNFSYGGEEFNCNLSDLRDPVILTNMVIRRIMHGIASCDLDTKSLEQIVYSWSIKNHFRMSYWTFTPAHSTGNRVFRHAARELCNEIYGAVCKTS